MKKTILILTVLIAAIAWGVSNPVHNETPQFTWRTIRDAEAASDIALDATTKKWADKPSETYALPESFNNIEIRFRGNDAYATANYAVYIYNTDDDATLVCSGAIVAGDQTATMGGFYCDTISATDYWPTNVVTADASANNGMGRIAFDGLGSSHLFVELTSISDDDTISVDIRGF